MTHMKALAVVDGLRELAAPARPSQALLGKDYAPRYTVVVNFITEQHERLRSFDVAGWSALTRARPTLVKVEPCLWRLGLKRQGRIAGLEIHQASELPGRDRTRAFPSLTIGALMGLQHRSQHASYHDDEMVSRGSIFALSTTSGQGMDTCIG